MQSMKITILIEIHGALNLLCKLIYTEHGLGKTYRLKLNKKWLHIISRKNAANYLFNSFFFWRKIRQIKLNENLNFAMVTIFLHELFLLQSNFTKVFSFLKNLFMIWLLFSVQFIPFSTHFRNLGICISFCSKWHFASNQMDFTKCFTFLLKNIFVSKLCI